MDDLVIFIKENYFTILLIVFVVFALMALFEIKGINLNTPKVETHLIQQVTVETFEPNQGRSMMDSSENLDQLKMMPSESFCESYLGDSVNLESGCNQLTESNCAEVKCCGFVKNGATGKCVAGSNFGPTYRTDTSGQPIPMDSYYYLGKRY